VTFDAAADAADILGFGEVHFEQEAAAGAEGEEVFVGRGGQLAQGDEGLVHGDLYSTVRPASVMTWGVS
jgi:hypothetical protein